MLYDWSADTLRTRHVAAFLAGPLLAMAAALLFAAAQPWSPGLSFVGSLYVLVSVWGGAVLWAYFTRRARLLLAAYLGGTTLLTGVLIVMA